MGTMESKIKYWIDLSDYDLETANVMLKSKTYLWVGFMHHQTIEKAFIAYYIKLKSDAAPYSHSLSYIAKQGEFYESFRKKKKNLLIK
jgi:HEPN domain-containing protein